ncbi:molybdopterin-dependent oxidoreductase [Pseudorhodoferax soli]|uniref:Biotin/methionine sulfoxide reductase n=1 Tax=Pseudorhodoferax soli TaxID=545864 RepID=A0A368X887_9BURK|nr:molybdopterin-dependent oxidoreductase [Pseudorhodoferax soli]RCW63198.1 biotin/methionine sulfoxide reductase [Pseudorhodoferax soli]
MSKGRTLHSTHWGAFRGRFENGQLIMAPHTRDPDPSPLLENLKALRHRARVTRPMARKGWLQNGPGPDRRRGSDEFVPLSWDQALDLVAREVGRVAHEHGPQAVYGGSYGWASAGRFHHALSQVHRFLNVAIGGYVRSVNNYSAGAAQVVIPHVLGNFEQCTRKNVTWEQVAEHSEVVLAFGGLALKNSQVGQGGVSQHIERGCIRRAAERGCAFVGIGPQRSDMPEEARARWIAVRPGTDTALMLGMAHTLVAAGLHDQAFVNRHCTGWPEFQAYLLGLEDGIAKSAVWAADICDVPATTITELARSVMGKRCLVTVAHALQRAENGEQPVWMGAVLAALLGQYGLPGGGYNYALGTLAHYGRRTNKVSVGALPQGRNGVSAYIPVARIADMLLNPGQPFPYNGQTLAYPHIRLAYWAGGNPFHHHQDLARLTRAFATLDTFVVHESAWTATARHADLILPCTMSVEREDIGASGTDPLVVAMHRLAEPHGLARDDHDIFADLADRLGQRQPFTEGRSVRDWLAALYAPVIAGLDALGLPAPTFDEFWEQGELTLPQHADEGGVFSAFRRDPDRFPLATPSGKIHLASAAIASFGYASCPGIPAWIPPTEGPSAEYPLWLVANQPATRLHSQLDFGPYSQDAKRHGLEVCTISPAAAQARGIAEGDVVRLFNERGSCLASAQISPDIRADTLRLPTGAWYAPSIDGRGLPMCIHGNPNILTRDFGTSPLAQACTGQLSRVELERYDHPVPPHRAFDPPGP